MLASRLARLSLAALLGLATMAFAPRFAVAEDDKKTEKKEEKSDEPKTADEALQAGLKSAQGNDLKKAGELFAKALKLDPKHRQALLFSARLEMIDASQAQGKKQYEAFQKAAGFMRRLKEAHPRLNPGEQGMFATCVYNEACAYAVDNKAEKAMASLKEAFASGFDQIDSLDSDDDLANVRKLPEFQKLKKELVAEAEKKAQEHAVELLKEGKPFPFDFELKNLDGKTVKLADFKGKVTIVDVWGTWCPPCRMEIPHFVDLHKKYGGKGFAIVGINYEGGNDEKEDIAKIKKFVKENKVPYECVLGDPKTQAKIPDFEGYPTTLFIDKAGKVRLKVVGYHPMAQLEALVKQLMSE